MVRKAIDNIGKKITNKELFRRGLYSGVGWAFGATIGFAIISTILVVFLSSLGGIPLIGGWIATIVSSTLDQLSNNTPIIPN